MKRRDALQRVALLMGGVLSAPTVFAFGGDEKISNPGAAGFVLNKAQKAIVSEFAEIIIPRTTTPGAKDAKVGPFIEVMLRDCYYPSQQEHFIKGIAEVESISKKMGASFIALPAAKKTSVVQKMLANAKMENESSKSAVKQIDTESGLEKQDHKKVEKLVPFFTLMKELTLLGYFTSQPGATKALDFVEIPGRYEGCFKMKPGQKAWAM